MASDNNKEVQKMNLKHVKLIEIQGWVENKFSTLEEKFFPGNSCKIFAEVSYPPLLEGQKLEIGFIQTIYFSRDYGRHDKFFEIRSYLNDMVGPNEPMLDGDIGSLNPYHDAERIDPRNAPAYAVISGPSKEGSVQLLLHDQPGGNFEQHHKVFKLFLVARDVTRLPIMRILKAMQWESMIFYDSVCDFTIGRYYQFKGPLPPFKQPAFIEPRTADLTEDIIRGPIANDVNGYIFQGITSSHKLYHQINHSYGYLRTNITNYINDDIDNKRPPLGVFLSHIKPIFSCVYFDRDFPNTRGDGKHFERSSPVFVFTTIVRVPPLLKDQKVDLQWKTFWMEDSSVYSSYTGGICSWEIPNVAKKLKKDMDSKSLEFVVSDLTNAECRVSGPTYTYQDVTLSIALHLRVKAPRQVSPTAEQSLIYVATRVELLSILKLTAAEQQGNIIPFIYPYCLSLQPDCCNHVEKPLGIYVDIDADEKRPVDGWHFLLWRKSRKKKKFNKISIFLNRPHIPSHWAIDALKAAHLKHTKKITFNLEDCYRIYI